jgi:hypothetical protein
MPGPGIGTGRVVSRRTTAPPLVHELAATAMSSMLPCVTADPTCSWSSSPRVARHGPVSRRPGDRQLIGAANTATTSATTASLRRPNFGFGGFMNCPQRVSSTRCSADCPVRCSRTRGNRSLTSSPDPRLLPGGLRRLALPSPPVSVVPTAGVSSEEMCRGRERWRLPIAR